MHTHARDVATRYTAYTSVLQMCTLAIFKHIYPKQLSAGYFLHIRRKDPDVYWLSPCTALLTMCTLGISVTI